MDHESVPDEPNELPVELMGLRRRRVRMTGAGLANVLAGTLFFFLGSTFGVTIAKSVMHDAAIQNELRSNGSESTGQVTSKRTGKLSSTYASYTFAVDGAIYSGEAKTPVDIWNRLHEADSLPIRYLPANPSVNYPAAWEDSTFSELWSIVLGAGLAFCGLLMVRKFPLQHRLAIEGVAACACISEREWKGPSKGQISVDYTFRNANDEVEIGSCRRDFPLKAGSKICVLYLPTDPSRSSIYPLEFFRIDH